MMFGRFSRARAAGLSTSRLSTGIAAVLAIGLAAYGVLGTPGARDAEVAADCGEHGAAVLVVGHGGEARLVPLAALPAMAKTFASGGASGEGRGTLGEALYCAPGAEDDAPLEEAREARPDRRAA